MLEICTLFCWKTYVKKNNVDCITKFEDKWDFTFSERRQKQKLTNSLVVDQNPQSKAKFPVFLWIQLFEHLKKQPAIVEILHQEKQQINPYHSCLHMGANSLSNVCRTLYLSIWLKAILHFYWRADFWKCALTQGWYSPVDVSSKDNLTVLSWFKGTICQIHTVT